MKIRVTAIGAFILLAGCGKPTDAVIPSDVAKWDKELAPQIQKLSEADRKRVAAYLMRAKVGEIIGGAGVQPGTTIGQALAEQQKWEVEQAAKRAEEEALKRKLEQDRAAAAERINRAVTVTLLDKRELPSDFRARRYSQQQQFRIGVQNISDKPIIGVSGEIKFIDVFDKEVGAVSFRISERIAPGATYTWTGVRDYNQFIDSHRALWDLEKGKYKTRFVPEMIVYEDGSKVGLPD